MGITRRINLTIATLVICFLITPMGALSQIPDDAVRIAACRSPYNLEIIGGNTVVCVVRGNLEGKQYLSYNPCPAPGGAWGNELANGEDRCIAYGRTLPAAPCPINTHRERKVGNPDRCYRTTILQTNVVMKAQDVSGGVIGTFPGAVIHRDQSQAPSVSSRQTLAHTCPTYPFFRVGPIQAYCIKEGNVPIRDYQSIYEYEPCKPSPGEIRVEDKDGMDKCKITKTQQITSAIPCSGKYPKREIEKNRNDRCYRTRYQYQVVEARDTKIIAKTWDSYVETHRLHEN